MDSYEYSSLQEYSSSQEYLSSSQMSFMSIQKIETGTPRCALLLSSQHRADNQLGI